MTIRAALKILKMSKKALTAKYGRTATSKVIDARLTPVSYTHLTLPTILRV